MLRRDERAFCVGGVGTGKSELSERLARLFCAHYARLGARRLIVDSKPRFRAEYTAQGTSAKRRYRKWSHGQYIPGSVVADDPRDLGLAFDQSNTVIVQGQGAKDIPRLVSSVEWFLEHSRHSRPQLVQIDETMDFYHQNGSPIGGNDAIVRTARAGRERGTSGLYCAQRTRGIPVTLMEEMDRLYALRIDAKGDAKRLQEMGAPEFALPSEKQQFMYWWKGDYSHVWGPYRLDLA